MILGLKRARALIEENGWVGHEREPMCARSDGSYCFESDEGVATYSVAGALLVAGCYPEAWHILESVVSPSVATWHRFQPTKADGRKTAFLARTAMTELPLHLWLQQPERTWREILGVFVKAIARAKKTQREG